MGWNEENGREGAKEGPRRRRGWPVPTYPLWSPPKAVHVRLGQMDEALGGRRA
jgi:hypothetical protein